MKRKLVHIEKIRWEFWDRSLRKGYVWRDVYIGDSIFTPVCITPTESGMDITCLLRLS